jgi:hypothetical protein
MHADKNMDWVRSMFTKVHIFLLVSQDCSAPPSIFSRPVCPISYVHIFPRGEKMTQNLSGVKPDWDQRPESVDLIVIPTPIS